jgi:hypothetical protein
MTSNTLAQNQFQPAAPPESLLIQHVKAHIKQGEKAKARADQARDKAEQHLISAGVHLQTLRTHYCRNWQEWEILLKTKIGLSTGRASELMQIASGKKSLQGIRDSDSEKHRRLRQSSSGQIQCPEENKPPAELAFEPSTNKAPAPAPVSTANGQAEAIALVDSLVFSSSGTRDHAAQLLISGPRQSQFETAVTAVSDLYQTLAKAGR